MTEPDTCHYNITLQSPLFCHDVFRDVYSALLEGERGDFARSTLEFQHNLLTEEGLRVERREILERVGCLTMRKEFKDLEECGNEYHDLNKKYKELSDSCDKNDDEEKFKELQSRYDELMRVLSENGLVFPDEL